MKKTWNLINEAIGRKNKNYILLNQIHSEVNNKIINDSFEIANNSITISIKLV